jgi:hypothetical protein
MAIAIGGIAIGGTAAGAIARAAQFRLKDLKGGSSAALFLSLALVG